MTKACQCSQCQCQMTVYSAKTTNKFLLIWQFKNYNPEKINSYKCQAISIHIGSSNNPPSYWQTLIDHYKVQTLHSFADVS